MRTITYQIIDFTDEPEHGGFSIQETETLHATTGDEQSHHLFPKWFATRAEAQAELDAIFAEHALAFQLEAEKEGC